MEFRREPLITAFNFTSEYQEQNGVNSGSVVPVMMFILNRVNRRWANAQFVKLNQCSVLWLFSCWSISEYIWSLMANFFFFSVLSSNCSSSLGYESVDSSVRRSSYRPCSRASSRNSGLLVIKSSFRLSAFVISISVSLLSKNNLSERKSLVRERCSRWSRMSEMLAETSIPIKPPIPMKRPLAGHLPLERHNTAAGGPRPQNRSADRAPGLPYYPRELPGPLDKTVC